MSDEIGKHVEHRHQISPNKESESWLFIVPSLAVGGSEKKTVMIVNNLAARGYEVHLVYLKSPDYLVEKVSDKVKLVMLDRKSRIDLKAIARLRAYIKNNNITKVWNVNLFSMLYGFFATLFMGKKIDRIVSINTTHFPNLKEALQMIVYVPIIYRMNRIIFGCEMQRRRWVRLFFLPNSKSSVIYNGVDTEHYQKNALQFSRDEMRQKYGVKNDEVAIGMVARFKREKDHASVIQAVKNLADKGYKVKLLFAGDGRERERLEDLVKSKNLQDRVVFLGNVQDVREALIAFDVFVLASIAVETFSNAALEAMSMSKPVILSDISGAPEMVDNGKNGYLFEPGNVEELTSALIKMMDVEARGIFARAAREKTCSKFSFERMVEDYISA